MPCNCHRNPSLKSDPSRIAADGPTASRDPDMLRRLRGEGSPEPTSADVAQPFAASTAGQLCREGRVKLGREAEILLDDAMAPQAYYKVLMAADHLPEARRVLALAMPKRRALWWGCLCALDAYGGDLPSQAAEAVDVVVRFVCDPSEANRRETERVGRSLPSSRLEGCLAMAAFFSGGSVSLPHLPAVYPRSYVTGRLVGVCVYLASAIRSARNYKTHLRQYLAMGEQIARGENLWFPAAAQGSILVYEQQSPLKGMHLRREVVTPSEEESETFL